MNNPEEEKEAKKELVAQEAQEFEQMKLELQGEKVIIDYGSKRGSYTGERFERDHPQSAKIALKWLALGHKFQRIADFLNVERRTIEAFYYRKLDKVQDQKVELQKEVFPIVMQTAQKMSELVEQSSNLYHVSGAHSIARDTWMHLTAQPTARIEISGHVDIDAKIEHLIKTATEEMKAAKARLVDDPTSPMLENGAAA